MTPVDTAAARKLAEAATPGPWTVEPHSHRARGCRCLSCDDEPVGWFVDNPSWLACEDIVSARSSRGECNDFGRELNSCSDSGPLMSYSDAEFIAASRTLVPAMADEIDSLRAENAELQAALAYSNNAREIMRHEKEHGWEEAEKFEARADAAEAQVKRVLDLCDVVAGRMMATAKPGEIRAAIRRAVGDTQ